MNTPSSIPVAVLGATGLVGQHLIRRLDGHPWFHVAEVVASDSRAGSLYGEAVSWMAGGTVPGSLAGLRLRSLDAPLSSPVVLSALPADVARAVEPALAARGHFVSSNASAHRMDPEIPLIVPEVNAESVALVLGQAWAAAGGALVTNPNCVVSGLAPVLAHIDAQWPVTSLVVVTLQALSGAGLAGPSALAAQGNVIPFIAGEEEKIQAELSRIMGRPLQIETAVNRVPVVDGHLAHVFLEIGADIQPADLIRTMREAQAPHGVKGLPTVPLQTFRVLEDPSRPQPRLDLDVGSGMTIAVGRIRGGPRRIALTVLSHNLVRGAAGACIANAELLVTRMRLRAAGAER